MYKDLGFHQPYVIELNFKHLRNATYKSTSGAIAYIEVN